MLIEHKSIYSKMFSRGVNKMIYSDFDKEDLKFA